MNFSFNAHDQINIHYLTDYIKNFKAILNEIIPIISYFIGDPIHNYKIILNNILNKIKTIHRIHEQNIGAKDKINDFCDILIKTKIEAIEESKDTINILTENNCSIIIVNLIQGII